MKWRNTPTSYGLITRLFHWSMAVLVIALIAVGLYMSDMERGPLMIKLYGLHKATGLLILFMVIARLSWRLSNKVPHLPRDMNQTERFSAHVSHFLLYACLFLMPLSGWLMSSGSGYSVSFFGLFVMPDLIAQDKAFASLMYDMHYYTARLLIALIAVHFAAAMWHQFIRKDNLLTRMWSGKEEG